MMLFTELREDFKRDLLGIELKALSAALPVSGGFHVRVPLLVCWVFLYS